MNRIMPSVSFNLDNDYERGLYEYAAEQDYFSKYVKRLIERDRAGIPSAPIQTIVPVPEEKEMKFTKTAIKAFF